LANRVWCTIYTPYICIFITKVDIFLHSFIIETGC